MAFYFGFWWFPRSALWFSWLLQALLYRIAISSSSCSSSLSFSFEEFSNSSIIKSCVFFFVRFLAMFLIYSQKHHFQFLVRVRKTQQAINYNKDNSKEKQNKIEKTTWWSKTFSSLQLSAMDELIDSRVSGYWSKSFSSTFNKIYLPFLLLISAAKLSVQLFLFQRRQNFIFTVQRLFKRWINHSFVFLTHK